MPIAVVAVAEIVFAIILAIVLPIWFADVDGLVPPAPHVLAALTLLNAAAILGVVRSRPERAPLTGLWLAALGGFFLFASAANPIYAAYLFPPSDSFIELLKPAVHQFMALATLLLAALLSLVAGWGLVFVSRWRARRGRA